MPVLPVSTWIGRAPGGSWFNAAKWNSGGVPVAGTKAVFKTGHAEAVDLTPLAGGSAAEAGEAAITGDAVTFAGGTLLLAPPFPARGLPVALLIGGGGSVTIAADASLTAQGEVLATGGTLSPSLVINGALTDIQGGIEGTGANAAVVSGHAAHWSNTQDLFIGGGSLSVLAGGTVDGGPQAFTTGSSNIEVGNGLGYGRVLVRGAGSLLSATQVDIGTGYSGHMTICCGAHVVDNFGAAGGNGDGYVTVTGAGSRWQNLGGLQIGSAVPAASWLRISNHATVTTGGVVTVAGTLALDSTATLEADTIVSLGGSVRALGYGPAGGGTVAIGATLEFGGNAGAPFELETTYLSASRTAVLALNGPVLASDPYAILQAGVGHIVLDNAGNALPAIHIYGAVLELAVTGAAGAAAISFLKGASPVLQVDAGVALPNPISGFAARDAFDLPGIAYSPDLIPGWTPALGGGTLTLDDGSHAQSLTLLGHDSAASFHAADDGHGGTLVTFVTGH